MYHYASLDQMKIWKTVPDVIAPSRQPGNRGNETDVMPSTREILLVHLLSVPSNTDVCPRTQLDFLSQLEVTQASASATTEASLTTIAIPQPTSQQILTAYLLVTLLSEPPHYSLSMNKVKELLLEKMGGDAACIG